MGDIPIFGTFDDIGQLAKAAMRRGGRRSIGQHMWIRSGRWKPYKKQENDDPKRRLGVGY